jgi:hypothetical protein
MVGPHTGEDMAKQLIACLDMLDPSLKEKVISVTADGARVNTTTTSSMRDYIVEAFNQPKDDVSGVDAGTMLFSYHWDGKPIWCILHQINLIVQKFIQELTQEMIHGGPDHLYGTQESSSEEYDTIFSRWFSNTREAMSSFSHMNIIDKIGKILKSIKASPQKLQKFVSICSVTGEPMIHYMIKLNSYRAGCAHPVEFIVLHFRLGS